MEKKELIKELITTAETKSGVWTITLNDPETKNAMSEEMATAFAQAVAFVKQQTSLRAVVLRGAGDAFSAGGHLDMLQKKTQISKHENEKLMLDFYNKFLSFRSLPVPIIAAINGHAVGAGFCIALACDLRIALRRAKMGLNFLRLGLHPGMAATYFLPRLAGPARAAELLYTGKILSADEAHVFGLVNSVVEDAQFEQHLEQLTDAISSAGPLATAQLRETLHTSRSLEQSLEREASCQALNYSSKEFQEGINAAREKRRPNF